MSFHCKRAHLARPSIVGAADIAPAEPSAAKPPSVLEGESDKARIERLGRQRPEQLVSGWREIGFVFSIVMSQALTEYFVSGFTVLVPTIAEDLSIPSQSITWPAAAFSLTVSACMLPLGRLADIYGGFYVHLAGNIWYCIWGLITGFSQNEIMLDVCRAMQGLGPAAFLPAGLVLLGNMYRPGPRKNVIFSIYGAMAPLGFFIGIFFGGVAGQYATWRWYFWIGTILAVPTTVLLYFTVPNDYAEHTNNGVKMDWLGSITTICGLVLLVFAITDSSHAPNGWATPYIIVTLILAILFLTAAFYVEGWIAKQPLLPFEVFKIKYVRPFVVGLLFAYGTLGVFLLYSALYCRNILGIGPIQLVAWYVPMGLGGFVLAIIEGFFLHKIPPMLLMITCCLAIIVDSLLFALQPVHAGYWSWVFPAMVCATIAIDLLFSVASIFFSTALPARQQGLAGALSNVLVQLGIALSLGFADIVVSNTAGQGERQSYKNAFWFELGCGGFALVIFVLFVRIHAAQSDLTADEKEEQKAAEVDLSIQQKEKQ